MINLTVAGAINDPEFYSSPLASLGVRGRILLIRGGACYEIEILQNKRGLRH
jgi:hypothetical protein